MLFCSWVHGFECWVAEILQVWKWRGRHWQRPVSVEGPRGMSGGGVGLVRRARKFRWWQEEAAEVSDLR